MGDIRGNLQDEFLNQIRKEKLPVSIHVINGYQFNHLKVISFDNYVILAEDDRGVQRMIYKHAVSTITLEQKNVKEEKSKSDD
jgi:host factor-I protein